MDCICRIGIVGGIFGMNMNGVMVVVIKSVMASTGMSKIIGIGLVFGSASRLLRGQVVNSNCH